MEGLFVDKQFCVQVVVKNRTTNGEEWIVYHNDGEQDSMKMMKFEEPKIKLEIHDKINVGMFDQNTNTIHWENGDVWNQLSISYNQWQLFTRRPYVPMTLLLFSIFYDGYTVFRQFCHKITGKSPEHKKDSSDINENVATATNDKKHD